MTLGELREALDLIPDFRNDYEVLFVTRDDEEFSIKAVKTSAICHLVELREKDIRE